MSDNDACGLLDTSVVIELGAVEATELPAESLVSTITLAELSVGPLVARTLKERTARQAVLQIAEGHFRPLPFDEDIARVFGRIAAELRSAGSKRRARAFDALIAATAIRHDLPLYTRNPEDFEGISGLVVRSVE